MKIIKIALSLFFVLQTVFFIAHDEQVKDKNIEQKVMKTCCHCGPIEHVFHKLCVTKYNKMFTATGLLENNDYEGLPLHIIIALQNLVDTIKFVDEHGHSIVPTVNAKGNFILSMSKNPDYVMLKKILAKVDTTTTLSSDELCKQWLQELEFMKIVK